MSDRPIPSAGAVAGTTSTRDGEDWRHRAACLNADPEIFFAAEGERSDRSRPRIAEAKAICHACPVQRQCRDEALADRIPYGVWGGLDEDERGTARRRHPTPAQPAQPRPGRVRDECGTGRGLTLHRRHNERRCRACLDHDTAQRIRRFTETIGDAAALADAGHTLDEAAAILGASPDELARALRPDQYPVLARLRRNPGASGRDTAA